jgi:hypothetical protein
MPSSSRGSEYQMEKNERTGGWQIALPILVTVSLFLGSCKMLNRTVSRDTFVKDYSKIESTWELTPFQDSVMRDIGYLSRGTDEYIKAIRANEGDTAAVDPDNLMSAKYFNDLKVRKVSYADLLTEIGSYDIALNETRNNILKIGAEIENRCLNYQKQVETNLDSVSKLFNYRLTELEQRNKSTLFSIVITRQNTYQIEDMTVRVLFFARNSNKLLFDFPLEVPGCVPDTIKISKSLTRKDFSNPSYEYFRSILDGRDYDMKFNIQKMKFENKPFVGRYNYYYYKLNSFLWGDGECPYFSEAESKKLTDAYQKNIKRLGTLIDNYPCLAAKEQIGRREMVKMVRGN